MNIVEIKQKLQTQKITLAQIDPFSFCNAKCWYCPVKYTPNPREAIKHMSPDLLEKIIANIVLEKNNGVVSPNFNFIYTAHYNEVLLYKHFEQLVHIFKKYNIRTYVLSNGVPLTPEKTDFIEKHQDTVVGICLNIPAFERDIWSKRSGMSPNLFDKLINNVSYAADKLKNLIANKAFSIQINSATELSFYERGGWITKGPDFPQDLDLNINNGELATQHKICKDLFPTVNIYPMPSLIDRAGFLNKVGVISNKEAIEERLKKRSICVTGCGNGVEVGGRPFGWLHVNARGDAFLCCNDYNFEHVFGNFEQQTLKDMWVTDYHAAIILKSFESICTKCASSLW